MQITDACPIIITESLPGTLKGSESLLRFLKRENRLCEINADDIICKNRGRSIDRYELNKLANSIRLNGIIQPITVKPSETDGKYMLIAGERRLKAAQLAGIRTIPCLVINADNGSAQMLSLVENTSRHSLNMFEEAEEIAAIIDSGNLTQIEAADRLSMAQSTLSNKLRILKLNAEQRQKAINAGLSERHIRAVIRIIDSSSRNKALDEIIAKSMNSAEAEQYVEQLLNPKKEQRPPRRTPAFCDIRLLENTYNKTVESFKRAGFIVGSTVSDDSEKYTFVLTVKKQEI